VKGSPRTEAQYGRRAHQLRARALRSPPVRSRAPTARRERLLGLRSRRAAGGAGVRRWRAELDADIVVRPRPAKPLQDTAIRHDAPQPERAGARAGESGL
jgi:hypothetical protein